MSFTFGQFRFADALPTSFAIQRQFPNMSNLGVESLEVPGMERRRFLQTDRPFTGITFDVILHADSEEELETRRDQLMMLLDPALGPQSLVLDDHPDWYWTAAVSDEIVWEKLTWGCEYRGFRYQGDVTFETYGDAASRHVEAGGLEVSGELDIPPQGTTRSWPRWEFSEPLLSDQSVHFTVSPVLGAPQHEVYVEGPLNAGQTMVLDYDTMEFAVWQGTTKVASLVDRMSTLERPELHPILGEVQVSVNVWRLVEYEWAGTPHASPSIKYVDGVEVARNELSNPSFELGLDGVSSSGTATLSHLNGTSIGSIGTYAMTVVIEDSTASGGWVMQSYNIEPSTSTRWAGISTVARNSVGVGDGVRHYIQLRQDGVNLVAEYLNEQTNMRSEGLSDQPRLISVMEVPPNTDEVRVWLRPNTDIEFGRYHTDAWVSSLGSTRAEALAQVRTYWDGDSPGGFRNEDTTALFYPNSRRQ